MFTITKGGTYTVNKAASGTKKDGKPYALLKFVEAENQPAGIERPSRSNSAVNCWFEQFPEAVKGVKDGALVKLIDFSGVKWIHEEYFMRDGSKGYRDVLELCDPVVELA